MRRITNGLTDLFMLTAGIMFGWLIREYFYMKETNRSKPRYNANYSNYAKI